MMSVQGKRKFRTTEMRMLRMSCGETLNYNVNNEKIREMMGV